jgi:hypothetical protein
VQGNAIQQLLPQEIDAGTLPPLTATLFSDFCPPARRRFVCHKIQLYFHSMYYAIMPCPNRSGCSGGLAVINALTSTPSHLVCESIIDPLPGQGW